MLTVDLQLARVLMEPFRQMGAIFIRRTLYVYITCEIHIVIKQGVQHLYLIAKLKYII